MNHNHRHEKIKKENNGIKTNSHETNDQHPFISSEPNEDDVWDEIKKRQKWETELETMYEGFHVDLYALKNTTENFQRDPKLLLETDDLKGYDILCKNEISKNFIVKNEKLISQNVLISLIAILSKKHDEQSLKTINLLQTELLNMFLNQPYHFVKQVRVYLHSNFYLSQILFRFIEESKIVKDEEKKKMFSDEYDLARYLNTSKDRRSSFKSFVEWIAEYLILRLKYETISSTGKNFMYDVIDQNSAFIFSHFNQELKQLYFEVGDTKLIKFYEDAQKNYKAA